MSNITDSFIQYLYKRVNNTIRNFFAIDNEYDAAEHFAWECGNSLTKALIRVIIESDSSFAPSCR